MSVMGFPSTCSVILLLVVVASSVGKCKVAAFYLNKRIAPENNVENFDNQFNQLQTSYDEYPMVVPKRAAILLDRLMVALHHALEDEKDGSRKIADVYAKHSDRNKLEPKLLLNDPSHEIDKGRYDIVPNSIEDFEVRELKTDNNQAIGENLIEPSFQRRAHEEDGSGRNNGRVYWRCYFNAVTCF